MMRLSSGIGAAIWRCVYIWWNLIYSIFTWKCVTQKKEILWNQSIGEDFDGFSRLGFWQCPPISQMDVFWKSFERAKDKDPRLEWTKQQPWFTCKDFKLLALPWMTKPNKHVQQTHSKSLRVTKSLQQNRHSPIYLKLVSRNLLEGAVGEQMVARFQEKPA